MRKIAQIMGIPVSLDIPECSDEVVLESAFTLLRSVDKRFSTYKPNSELVRYQKGLLKESNLSPDMLYVFQDCLRYTDETNGYFSPYFNGAFDPTGYVKGWAIEEVSCLLTRLGFTTYCINAGGDILLKSNTDTVWRIALQHPSDETAIMATIAAKNLAIATSGTYARGNHIFDPHTQRQTKSLISVTVIGPDIIKADVLATAIFAMGLKGIDFINNEPNYETLLIDKTLHAHMSAHFQSSTNVD